MSTGLKKARQAAAQRTMQAAVVHAPQQVRLVQAPMPQPGPRQVRVRLEGCGVCASNLPPWEGRPWFEYPMAPGALGHEAWGYVDAVGAETRRLSVGQRVALLSSHGYAQYDVADEDHAVPLPPELDDVPFPGEPLACAVNVLNRATRDLEQSGPAPVAVIGAGFLGALLIQLLSRQGHVVTALSRRPFALEVARRSGAAHTLACDDPEEAQRQALRHAGHDGFPCVIECTGVQQGLDLAAALVATRGRLVVAGYHHDGLRSVNLQQWNWRGIDVINAHERDPALFRRGLEQAVAAVLAGRLRPAPLYTHHFTLDALDQALQVTRQRPHGFLKALVTFGGPP